MGAFGFVGSLLALLGQIDELELEGWLGSATWSGSTAKIGDTEDFDHASCIRGTIKNSSSRCSSSEMPIARRKVRPSSRTVQP